MLSARKIVTVTRYLDGSLIVTCKTERTFPRDDKSSENGGGDFSPTSAATNDVDRDAKVREIVTHIYKYVSRQYGLRQMAAVSQVSPWA